MKAEVTCLILLLWYLAWTHDVVGAHEILLIE